MYTIYGKNKVLRAEDLEEAIAQATEQAKKEVRQQMQEQGVYEALTIDVSIDESSATSGLGGSIHLHTDVVARASSRVK